MSTVIPNLYSINGVISTDKTVMQNLNDLCSAASCWLTYDIADGKWSVIINRAGLASVASFNDSNIIGAINVTDTGITELYNSVAVEYPNKDIRDERDTIDITLDESVKFPNEVENTLNIQYDCINNQTQAQLLGTIELKQSRLNKIIEFQTDFSKIGLKAGDIIDVTNSIYGFSAKKFRILSLSEEDGENIIISITAQEYDESIYNTEGIIISNRTKNNGITIKSQNTEIQASIDADVGASLSRLLLANVGLGLLSKLFQRKENPTNPRGPSDFEAADKDADKILSSVKKPEICNLTASTESVCEGATVIITAEVCCETCLFDIPALDYTYSITGVSESDINVPVEGTIPIVPGSSGTLLITLVSDGSADSPESMTVTVGGQSVTVNIFDTLGYTYATSASPSNITEGSSSTVTLTTTGVADGTSIPYVITGSGTAKVTTPLTGNVTVSGNTASLTVNTSDDGVYTGEQSVLVTFNPSQADNCGELDKTASISIQDNETPPPPDTFCQTVTIPISWCPRYDGSTGLAKSLTVDSTATVLAAIPGKPSVAVPSSVSVNAGVVTITSTVNVDASTGKGGIDYNVITNFNTIDANGPVTGTTTIIRGF